MHRGAGVDRGPGERSRSRVLQRIEPSDAIARARCELAAEFIADLRRLGGQMRDTRNRLAAAVRASGSTPTGIFGAGPVIAAAILGAAGDASRFGDRNRFAAYNGTAPIEVSSGERKIHRLSLRGNRRLNHAIHMAAVTQIRYKHSRGRRPRKRGRLAPRTPALRTSHSRARPPHYGPGGQPRERRSQRHPPGSRQPGRPGTCHHDTNSRQKRAGPIPSGALVVRLPVPTARKRRGAFGLVWECRRRRMLGVVGPRAPCPLHERPQALNAAPCWAMPRPRVDQ
jgi:hypothetical protein